MDMSLMDLSLRARLERLGPTRDVDRVSSGSPAVLHLTLSSQGKIPNTVDAALSLAKRGLTLFNAKEVLEALLRDGSVVVDLPTVEDTGAVKSEFAAAEITAELRA